MLFAKNCDQAFRERVLFFFLISQPKHVGPLKDSPKEMVLLSTQNMC